MAISKFLTELLLYFTLTQLSSYIMTNLVYFYVNMVLTETKLWRKGPYEKPVLCNACGLHFKAKGTLENYIPKTAQQNLLSDPDVEKASESDPELSNEAPGNKKRNKLITYKGLSMNMYCV